MLAGLIEPLVRIELLVDDDAVLKIVDAEVGGFGEAYGTEMTGDFDAARVSGFDGGAEFGARDVHESFEGGGTGVGPIIDHASGFLGAGDRETANERAQAFKVRAGDVDFRPESCPSRSVALGRDPCTA